MSYEPLTKESAAKLTPGAACSLDTLGRTRHLGYFDDEVEAARAVDRGAIKYLGVDAAKPKLNFPISDYTATSMFKRMTKMYFRTPECIFMFLKKSLQQFNFDTTGTVLM